jgi:hypothetical protein
MGGARSFTRVVTGALPFPGSPTQPGRETWSYRGQVGALIPLRILGSHNLPSVPSANREEEGRT